MVRWKLKPHKIKVMSEGDLENQINQELTTAERSERHCVLCQCVSFPIDVKNFGGFLLGQSVYGIHAFVTGIIGRVQNLMPMCRTIKEIVPKPQEIQLPNITIPVIMSIPEQVQTTSVFDTLTSEVSELEIMTGVVTEIQKTFGMVSNEIFFLVSAIAGRFPKIGDKVVVEAELVSGMPFKFNGKKVQVVSKELGYKTEEEHSDATNSESESDSDNNEGC